MMVFFAYKQSDDRVLCLKAFFGDSVLCLQAFFDDSVLCLQAV